MKRCARCKAIKSPSEFFRNSWRPDGRTVYCKRCVSAVSRDWDRRNPEKRRGYDLARRLRNYGITAHEHKMLLEQQDRRCAICVRLFGEKRRAHIDHDHRTGKVRGLLCGSCNRAIGLLGDDPFVIGEASAYLENFEELSA